MTDRSARLGEDDVRRALATLDGWQHVGNRLQRTYRFRDFVEAVGYLTSAAMIVHELDHHPEWSNVGNVVRIDLTTHAAGGVTQRDVDLACRLHELAGRRMISPV